MASIVYVVIFNSFKSLFKRYCDVCICSAEKWGTEMLEIDCHITKDGQVVVCHDNDLFRTTLHTATIEEMLYEVRMTPYLKQLMRHCNPYLPSLWAGMNGCHLLSRGVGVETQYCNPYLPSLWPGMNGCHLLSRGVGVETQYCNPYLPSLWPGMNGCHLFLLKNLFLTCHVLPFIVMIADLGIFLSVAILIYSLVLL